MIVGLGIDIIEVQRIEIFIKNKTKNQLMRIFTEKEYEYALSSSNKIERFAARFAAKEAFFKAMGYGVLKEIELTHQNNVPCLQLHGSTKKKWEELNSPQILVSISHTKHYAQATVLLQQLNIV